MLLHSEASTPIRMPAVPRGGGRKKPNPRPVMDDGKTGVSFLACGRAFFFSSEDVALVRSHTWFAKSAKQPYPCTTFGNKRVRLQTLIMGVPIGTIVDHRDGNVLNNRRDNLRLATVSQNTANSKKRIGKSGFIGVHQYPQKRRQWRAQIETKKSKVPIGYFDTARDAAVAYDAVAKILFGEFAQTNRARGLLQ